VNVRVLVDFASAASYLAIEPARALESRVGATFQWLPFHGPALTLTEPAEATTDRGTKHRRLRAQYIARDLQRYAEARGLHLTDVHRKVDAGPASLALLWLNRCAPERAGDFVERVFQRVWRHNEPADAAFLENALGEFGSGFRDYRAGDAARDLQRVRDEATEIGVWISPAFVVGDEPFIGRQHLPIVEWLLAGQKGPPPI